MSFRQVKRGFSYAGFLNLSRCIGTTPTIIIPLFRRFDKDDSRPGGCGLRHKGRKQNLLDLPDGRCVLRLCKGGGYFKPINGKNGICFWHIRPPLSWMD